MAESEYKFRQKLNDKIERMLSRVKARRHRRLMLSNSLILRIEIKPSTDRRRYILSLAEILAFLEILSWKDEASLEERCGLIMPIFGDNDVSIITKQIISEQVRISSLLDIDYRRHADNIRGIFADNIEILSAILDSLVIFSVSGGFLSKAKYRFIRHIATIFKLDFNILDVFFLGYGVWDLSDAKNGLKLFLPNELFSVTTYDDSHDIIREIAHLDPYAIFGVSSTVSKKDLKSAYHRLLRENHPDILASKGLTKDVISEGEHRVEIIRIAYNNIYNKRLR